VAYQRRPELVLAILRLVSFELVRVLRVRVAVLVEEEALAHSWR